jgi:hypothetical protein
MLEHHGHAQRTRLVGCAHPHRLAVDEHLAAVGAHRAVDDLHEGGLAGAVLAEHRVDLARCHRQRHAVVGEDPGVALGDLA